MEAVATVPPFERFYVEHRDVVLGFLRRRLGAAGGRGRVPGDVPARAARLRPARARRPPARVDVLRIAGRVAIDTSRPHARQPGAAGLPSRTGVPRTRRSSIFRRGSPERARGVRAPLRVRPGLRRHRRRAGLHRRGRPPGRHVRGPRIEERRFHDLSPVSPPASARRRPQPACSTSASRWSDADPSVVPRRDGRGLAASSTRPSRSCTWNVWPVPRPPVLRSAWAVDERAPAAGRVLRGPARGVRARRRSAPAASSRARCSTSSRACRTARRRPTARSPASRPPRAARAVGGVINRDPIPIVLPCHRVVGANGSLAGYGGGIEGKSAAPARRRAALGGRATVVARAAEHDIVPVDVEAEAAQGARSHARASRRRTARPCRSRRRRGGGDDRLRRARARSGQAVADVDPLDEAKVGEVVEHAVDARDPDRPPSAPSLMDLLRDRQQSCPPKLVERPRARRRRGAGRAQGRSVCSRQTDGGHPEDDNGSHLC